TSSFVEFKKSCLMNAKIDAVTCVPSQIYSAYVNHCPGNNKQSDPVSFNPVYYTNNQKAEISFYPNPVSSQLFIEANGYFGPCIIDIYDVSGRKLYTQSANLLIGDQK